MTRATKTSTGALAMVLVCMGLGCQRPTSGGELQLAPHASEMFSDNGLSINGLSLNGMTTNGMTTNGLSLGALVSYGFAQNLFDTQGFSDWFNSNTPSYSAMVVKYVVRCAVPALGSRTATINGAVYLWPGELGLAPVWSSGGAMPVAEQQLVSACLAAHANKFGLHIALSIRGRFADGTTIPTSSLEKGTYSASEGCFFGNLFDGSGVFSAWDSGFSDPAVSSPRACARESGQPGDCAPMVSTLHSCSQVCTSLGSDGWTNCSWGGKTYLGLTTYLQPPDVYHCGDFVCQFTEACASRTTGRGCKSDCGTCP